MVQLCVDTSLSIAKKLLVVKACRVPKTCREIFLELGNSKLIPPDLAKKLSNSCGIRNILVHEYTELDLEIFFGGLKDGYKAFVEFIERVDEIL